MFLNVNLTTIASKVLLIQFWFMCSIDTQYLIQRLFKNTLFDWIFTGQKLLT
jgi:hypothetical protein